RIVRREPIEINPKSPIIEDLCSSDAGREIPPVQSGSVMEANATRTCGRPEDIQLVVNDAVLNQRGSNLSRGGEQAAAATRLIGGVQVVRVGRIEVIAEEQS